MTISRKSVIRPWIAMCDHLAEGMRLTEQYLGQAGLVCGAGPVRIIGKHEEQDLPRLQAAAPLRFPSHRPLPAIPLRTPRLTHYPRPDARVAPGYALCVALVCDEKPPACSVSMKATFIGGGPWNGQERDIDVGRGWACVVAARGDDTDAGSSPDNGFPILHVYARDDRQAGENPWVFRYLGELASSHLTGREWDLEVLLQEMSDRTQAKPSDTPEKSGD